MAPVVFQCVPIMQINTGSPLEHHWVLASASVVPVASQCTCGSSGLPAWSVQWYPSVLPESGLEVIRSSLPSMRPLMYTAGMVRVVWTQLNSCDLQPQIHKKTIMMLTSKTCAEWCWSTHMCYEQNWYPLQSSKLQVKAEYTETGPFAYWCPAILSFQTAWMLLCMLNSMCRGLCGLSQSLQWCSSVGCKS